MPENRPRTAVITQPTCLPWLGYFEQMARADVFVFLDVVQFVERSWHSRNRLKGSDQTPFWLTVPVRAHPQATRLQDIQISRDQPKWRQKHLRSIQMNLGSAPYFASLFPEVSEWINTQYEYLVDFNIAGIRLFARWLDLSPEFVRASTLDPEGQRTHLLVNLCRRLGAPRYYSAAGASGYMDEEKHLFLEAGIEVFYQDWMHPTYPQRGDGFLSHLSALDALMNIGPKATRALIEPPQEVTQNACPS
jgi:hypothetical protein